MMKRSLLCTVIAIFVASAYVYGEDDQSAPQTPPLTLWDCYDRALKQSELIAINGELIKEAEANFTQVLGTLLPHLSFLSTDYRQDAEGFSSHSFSQGKSSERKFVFTQALFSGFKEFAGMSGGANERNQRIQEKKRAEQLLFVDVANAFYLLIEEQEDLAALQQAREALAGRVDELEQREKLGRSKLSEVANTRTELYNVEADIELVKNLEMIARQLLEFLIGGPVDNVTYDTGPLPPLKDEAYYLARAYSRPDVQAFEQAWKVAKDALVVARSDFYPAVSLESNYYTQSSAILQDPVWSAALKVDIPIFEGTETIGAVRQSEAKSREAELQFLRSKRLAITDIRNTYTNVQMYITRTEALRKAFDAAETSYKLQQEDYRLNLVSNLDVLQAIQTMTQAQSRYIHALYATKRFYWQLIVAADENVTEKSNDTF